jgi:dTDP-3,4-didehydro-2,6-dideoxy-alpha-D-glucose 3-reductase
LGKSPCQKLNLRFMMRLGIIGAGSHFTKNICPLFLDNSIADFEVKLVHSRSRALEFSDLGFRTTNSMSQIFKQDLDACYISLPNTLHAAAIKEAIANDIHVICEKSLIVPGMLDLSVLGTPLRIKEAFMFKHHPLTHAVAKHFGANSVENVAIDFSIPHLSKHDIRYNPSLGGGALLDLGAYVISAMRHFFPRAQLMELSSNNDGYDVDVKGAAIYLCPSTSTKINLNWAFGDEYKNRIWWKSSLGMFETSRFFSKNSMERGYIFQIQDNDSPKIVEETPVENHFVNMFSSFSSDIRNSNHDNSVEVQQQQDLQEIVRLSKAYNHLRLS